jgi:nucleotide-binding universal stress UspA family protein
MEVVMATRGPAIIAGYDGSPGSVEALDWAVLEASYRRVPVTVCHAWISGYEGTPTKAAPRDAAKAGAAAAATERALTAAEPGAPDQGREQADRILASGVRHARASAAQCEVQPLLVCGPATRVLCEQSPGADMVVVGSRGAGGVTGLQLGSVGLQVAAHAQAPVTVVRGKWRPGPGRNRAPVVVGADGSPASQDALEFAIREAALRDVPLVAVCALSDSAGVFGIARGVEADFRAAVDRAQSRRPEILVERRVEQGAPRAALLTAASRGQLLVVGARGRGGLREMMLGSISLALLHHAPCPVTIVR